MKIKLLTGNAKVPTKNKGDAGYDLYCTEAVSIAPLTRKLVKTDISIAIPEGYYGHISDRSGNAYKKGAHILGKIIDSTYRGPIGVIVYNTDKNEPIEFDVGERCAQIIFKRYFEFPFEVVDDLDDTSRGDGGFGSTGD